MLPRRRLRFSLPLCPPHTITHTLACSLSHFVVVVVHSRALCCCRVRVLHLNSPVLPCHGSVTNDRDCHITFTHARTNYSRRTQPPSSPTYHFLCVCAPVCVYVRQCVNHTHIHARARNIHFLSRLLRLPLLLRLQFTISRARAFTTQSGG